MGVDRKFRVGSTEGLGGLYKTNKDRGLMMASGLFVEKVPCVPHAVYGEVIVNDFHGLSSLDFVYFSNH